MRISYVYIQLSCIILIDIVVHFDYHYSISISIYICSNQNHIRLPKQFTAGFHRFLTDLTVSHPWNFRMMTEAAPRVDDVYTTRPTRWSSASGRPRWASSPPTRTAGRSSSSRSAGPTPWSSSSKTSRRVCTPRCSRRRKRQGLWCVNLFELAHCRVAHLLSARAHRCALSKTTPSRRTPRTHTP